MVTSIEESSPQPLLLLSVLEAQVLGSSIEASLDLDDVSVFLTSRGMLYNPLLQGLVVCSSRRFHDFSEQFSFGNPE